MRSRGWLITFFALATFFILLLVLFFLPRSEHEEILAASNLAGQVTWERNWMTNHPVQGSAAVVFKAAGNRLDRLYRACGARLVVPLHDAFVFEAPMRCSRAVIPTFTGSDTPHP